MSYADSLRQQARWIREALDQATPQSERIDLGDVDVDELDAAAAEIERLRALVLNIQSQAERGFPLDLTKLASRCRAALTDQQSGPEKSS